jgi:hypothetical protein
VALKEQVQCSADRKCAKDDEECELHDSFGPGYRLIVKQ